jgi:hypothetical protein
MGGEGHLWWVGVTFNSFCQAKELEFENKQLRRTISSLAKATAAERDTYLSLQSDLEGYQDIVTSIAQEYDFTRSRDRVYACACAGGLGLCSDSRSLNPSSSWRRRASQQAGEKRQRPPPFLRRSGSMSSEDGWGAVQHADTRLRSGEAAAGAAEIGGGKEEIRMGSLAEAVHRLRTDYGPTTREDRLLLRVAAAQPPVK